MIKSRLEVLYESSKVELQKQFGYKNVMQIPKILKVTVSMGLGSDNDSKSFERAISELHLITGQKPVITQAKKSIAGFKLRAGMPNGLKVVLRRSMMYHFLDRFVNIALPRSRDFLGINSKQFDGRGNFSMGIKEQLIFPEVNYDEVDKVRGMNISIVTTAKTNDEACALLKIFNFPFMR